MTSLRASSRRDQAPSSFAPTLGRLCESAGVVAAAFVDKDGEAVDYAGRATPFDIRIAAAEWRIVLSRLQRGESQLGQTEQFVARASNKTFSIVTLPEGYALVVQLLPHCFRISPRALAEAVRELCAEAQLSTLRALPDWIRVQVQEDAASGVAERRPLLVWVGKQWRAVEVVEQIAGQDLALRRNETAYRVRLGSGVEGILLREPLSHWFAKPVSSFR